MYAAHRRACNWGAASFVGPAQRLFDLESEVTTVTIASTPQQRDDAFAVRIAVFVEEQRIPREEELDALDAGAVHCVGYEDGVPVAAGGVVLGSGYGKIGRMAVLATHRRQGLGASVLAEPARTKDDPKRELGRTFQRLTRLLTNAVQLDARYPDPGYQPSVRSGHWLAFQLLEHDIHHRAELLQRLALLDIAHGIDL